MRSQIFVLTFACAAAQIGTDLPDGAGLVRQSIHAAEASTFESQSDIIVEIDLPGAAKTIKMYSALRSKPPNRIRVDSTSAMGELRLVADGEFVWTWLSFLNQYTRKSVSSGALDEMKNLGFGTGASAEAALARARVIRREPVVSDGKTYDCWVIEIPFERYPLPVPAGTELRDGTMRVWIDIVSHAALRYETGGQMHAPNMPHPVKVQQSMIVRSLRMDVDLPDEVFRFEPPPDATHVSVFGPRTAGVNLTGKPVPAFALTTMDGTRYDAAKLRGKVVLMDFWTTWCEPCRSEMKDLDALHREYGDAGLVVLGLAVGEEKDIVVRFLNDHAVSYPMARVDVSLAESFGAGVYPTHVVIDREGVVAAHFPGAASRDRLLEVLSKAGLSLH